jgi:hypothetical protein
MVKSLNSFVKVGEQNFIVGLVIAANNKTGTMYL